MFTSQESMSRIRAGISCRMSWTHFKHGVEATPFEDGQLERFRHEAPQSFVFTQLSLLSSDLSFMNIRPGSVPSFSDHGDHVSHPRWVHRLCEVFLVIPAGSGESRLPNTASPPTPSQLFRATLAARLVPRHSPFDDGVNL